MENEIELSAIGEEVLEEERFRFPSDLDGKEYTKRKLSTEYGLDIDPGYSHMEMYSEGEYVFVVVTSGPEDDPDVVKYRIPKYQKSDGRDYDKTNCSLRKIGDVLRIRASVLSWSIDEV